MRTPRTLDLYLYDKFMSEQITILEAAREFHSHGWTNFVDEDFARRTFLRIAAGKR